MKIEKKALKKVYSKPAVGKIKIDRGISMVMQSDPPGDPGMKTGNPFK